MALPAVVSPQGDALDRQERHPVNHAPLVHGSTSARPAPPPLVGRNEVIDRLAAECARADGPPFARVLGEAGAGRTSLLRALRGRLRAAGIRTLSLSASQDDGGTRYSAVYRLLTCLPSVPEPPTGPAGPTSAREVLLDLVARVSAVPPDQRAPETDARLAAALAQVLRAHAPLVILVDDAHWLDGDSGRVVEPLARRLLGTGCGIVLSARVDGAPDPVGPFGGQEAEVVARMTDDGLLSSTVLRPLTRDQDHRLLTEWLQARPDPVLTRELRSLSRGNPAALRWAVRGLSESGALRVVDRHAYLVPQFEPPRFTTRSPLLAPIREAGPLARSVAEALAVLAPLGVGVETMLTEALAQPAPTVRGALDLLRRRRVLVAGRRGWRFRLPAVREALRAGLGPYQRRRLSALAVARVWEGGPTALDQDAVADLLVEAGGLVDPERAAAELTDRGGATLFTHGLRSARWLRAAAELITDPTRRAMTLVGHCAACAINERPTDAADSAEELISRHAPYVPESARQELGVIYVTCQWATGNTGPLRGIADGERTVLPGGPGQHAVSRAAALFQLQRYGEGRALLAATRDSWSREPASADFAHILGAGAAIWQGDPAEFREFLADSSRWRGQDVPQLRFERLRYQVSMLLAMGELTRTLELLSAEGIRVDQLLTTDQFMIHQMRGDWVAAMDVARRSMAAGNTVARPPGPTIMYRDAVKILAARGRLARANELAETARSQPVQADYLLDLAQARIRRLLGDGDGAILALRRGLDRAAAAGFVLGTDELWAELAEIAAAEGRVEEATGHLAAITSVARRMGTGRTELLSLRSQALVHRDRDAAAAAVELARERAQPSEIAGTALLASSLGYRPDELLPEAYQLFGDLDALLWRARTRNLMRAHNLPVPGRTATTAENELLLAVLVTEGLSNRELATALQTSEKSVEGRLTRLFAKGGYGSRVDLAAAMLTGEYP
ncbi:hypothetical protein C1701_26685 [Actinoalloteichus sp. AHMU CJ021]|nr:hypothetical protein C1701_26685 [Actinoalloteichus sp. AHMU CJ021]